MRRELCPLVLVLIILTLFLIGCCGPIATLTDDELKRKYVAFSPGRAIAHDIIWSAGGKSLQYATCRGRIAEELMKRGYTWNGHNWVMPKKGDKP